MCQGLPDIKAQVVYAVRTEMAQQVADICRRRTMLSIQANYGLDALRAIAQTLQTHCGWSEARCESSIAHYKKLMADNCIPDYAIAKVLGEKFVKSIAEGTSPGENRSLSEAEPSLR